MYTIAPEGMEVLKYLSQIHKNEICVILSGQDISIENAKDIFAKYSGIISDILPKTGSIYAEMLGKIHPMVRRNSLRLFLSYRRQDSSLFTDRIYDDLVKTFGKESIFRDLSSIASGKDFRVEIRSGIKKSDVVLVIIGSKWANIATEDGQLRLFDPGDYVRFEIEEAIRENKADNPIASRQCRNAII